LGERLLCKQEVTGSIPVSSTRSLHPDRMRGDLKESPEDKLLLDVGRQSQSGLAPNIEQVRRAAIVQRHLTLSAMPQG
jgi:hypothetical protein